MIADKDVKQLVRVARSNGWTLVPPRGKGHAHLTRGETSIAVPCTPNSRMLRTFRRQLRRAGAIP